MRAFGSAVGLIVAIDEVTSDTRKKSLCVVLCLQLPPAAEKVALQHSLVRKIVDGVKKAVADDTGIVPTMQLTFDPLYDGPIGHLRPLVTNATTPPKRSDVREKALTKRPLSTTRCGRRARSTAISCRARLGRSNARPG